MADVKALQKPGLSPFEQKASENMLQKSNIGKSRQDMSSTEESGGDEGDDEAEGDKGETGADEEEEEEEEEEPKLKYQRLWGSLPDILAKENAASCLGVAEKMLALGTHNGGVHILDFSGHEVKCFPSHTAAVNEVSFDLAGEYVASCSDDGTVVVNGLYTEERERYAYHRPMKTVAIDPDFATKKDRQFVAGGLAGTLILHTKGWLGPKDTVLHSGEGPIHAVRWRTSLVAWANDLGVKLYDMATGQRISYIDMPRGSVSSGLVRPHLVWQDDSLLVIGWADTIKLAAIRTKTPNPPETPKPSSNGGALMPATAASNLMAGLNAMDFLGAAKQVGLSLPGPAKYVEILASIQTDYLISGIAPYGKELVVLAYIQDQVQGATNPISPPSATGQRPEVRILTRENEELTSDALSVNGYQQYEAKDYRLVHAPFMGSSEKGGQWSSGDEPLYYIVSPKDVVQAKPRDADDHVAWLVQHGRHEKALEAVEKGGARQEVLEEVGARYLDHLVLERQYAKAAQLCPKLLKGNAAAWERWVFHFAHLRQLPALAPYIPTSNPQLRETVYEVVLNAFLATPSEHERFLDLVRTWPPTLYTVATMIAAVQQRLVAFPHSAALQAALAELYLHNKQWEEALGLYLQLRRTDVFDFIDRHKLQAACRDKALPLLKLDAPRAVTMLVQHRSDIPPSEVVSQIQHEMRRQKRAATAVPTGENGSAGSQADSKPGRTRRDVRKLLHLYLHGLFEVDMTAGKEYHGIQVELYADYDQRFLLPFLRSSSFYPLEKAYETCKARGLTREVVFILGRMGNSREALGLIIEELHDMDQAIEFVSSQHDDELWEELISHSIHNPGMVGALLEHTVGNIDPLALINRVPKGMEIPRLRDRLARIISDYRTETSLREGCNNILQSDCVTLLIKFYNEARHAVRVGEPDPTVPAKVEPPTSSSVPSLLNLPGFFPPPTVSSDELDRLPLLPSDEGSEVFGAFSFDAFVGTPKPAPVQSKDASKKKTGAGNKPGRCSICLEPISVKDAEIVAFFCWHVYHLSCLSESEKRGQGEAQESTDGHKEGDEVLRCVLCTTAAAAKRNAHLLRTTTGSTDTSQSMSSMGWGQGIAA